jgi:uncharacterized membrane protein
MESWSLYTFCTLVMCVSLVIAILMVLVIDLLYYRRGSVWLAASITLVVAISVMVIALGVAYFSVVLSPL